MKISVLGCGRWGSFLAWYANSLGHDVVSWGREGEYSYDILARTRANEYVKLDDNIELSSDLEYAVSRADIIIVSISSQSLREFIARVAVCRPKADIVLCMKGIEVQSGDRLSTICIEQGIDKNKLAVWVGPGHIQDFTRGIPNCMVIDSHNKALTEKLVEIFHSKLIRFYYGSDIVGTEVGAATKNIMGIVAGILDGLGLSTLKGPLMTRGAAEVARLIKSLGGNPMSAYGLCHLGDYETTLFSPHSHNRKWGEMFATKQSLDVNKLAEGVATARAVARLGKLLKIDLPITNMVDSVICGKQKLETAIEKLLERELKHEFHS